MYPIRDGSDDFCFAEGTLLRMTLKTSSQLAKQVMRQTIKHYGSPLYVDIVGVKAGTQVTLRFDSQKNCHGFLLKAADAESDISFLPGTGLKANQAFKNTVLRLSNNSIV